DSETESRRCAGSSVSARPIGEEAMKDIDWDLVRLDYEARLLTLAAMETKFGVSKSAIIMHANAGGWLPRRKTVATRTSILSRVYRSLAGQTQRMEDAMEQGDDRYGMADLAAATQTLEKLIALNRAETARKRNPPESAVMQ